jgi:hypothetical protein
LHRWVIPAALVVMGLLTAALILVALGVLFRLIPWQ